MFLETVTGFSSLLCKLQHLLCTWLHVSLCHRKERYLKSLRHLYTRLCLLPFSWFWFYSHHFEAGWQESHAVFKMRLQKEFLLWHKSILFLIPFPVIPATWWGFLLRSVLPAGRVVTGTNALLNGQELFWNSQLCSHVWVVFLLYSPCSFSVHVSCSSFISGDLPVPLCLVPLNAAAAPQWY